MGMQALGRTFNWQYLMDGKYVNMKNVAGVAFLCYLTGAAGDTYTLVEAKDASGTGAQNLATVTEYWTCTGDGSDAWTKRTQAAAATVTTAAAATQNCMVFEVQSVELSDTYKYVKVTSTGAGIVTALHTNLLVQRTPANLPAMGV
jgi:hypothetical protein